MNMQNYTTPFANTGDTEEFSIDTDPSGKVSLEKGWTELYQLRPEEGGLFILRRVFNQMMKLVSTDTVTWKTQSFPNWIDDKGDGLPYAYPKNAIVKHIDGENYVSLIDDNEDNPIGSDNWINLAEYGREKEISLTGIATFNRTTQNINLTNIGNITLAIGDVIEVTGTTSNNKLFTVESIVNNNNIVVNYEHRGTTTPIPSKRLIDETASNCTITLYNRAKNAPVGQGQDWVKVTRPTNNTAINNNTNRLLKVIYGRNQNTSMIRVTAKVGNNGEIYGNTNDNTKMNAFNYVALDVPVGKDYYLGASGVGDVGANITVEELR